MAHRIINLVGSMVGRAEMLLETMDPADPMHAELVKMVRAGNEASGLTRLLADAVGPQHEMVR